MRRNALFTRILPLLMASMLAACGGGGNRPVDEGADTPAGQPQNDDDLIVGGERGVSNPEADVMMAAPGDILTCGGPATFGYNTVHITGTNTRDIEIPHGGHNLRVHRGVVPPGAKLQPWLIPDRYNRAVVHLLAFPGGAEHGNATDGRPRFRVRIAFGPCSGAAPIAVRRLEDGMLIPNDSVVANSHIVFSTDRFSTYAVVRPDPDPDPPGGN